MDSTLALTAAMWMWTAAGAALHILMIVIVAMSRDDIDEFTTHLGLLAIGFASNGLLVSGLSMLGYAVVAQWAWRISGAALVIFAAFTQPRTSVGPGTRALASANMVVCLVIAALGFVVGPVTPRLATRAPATAVTAQQSVEPAHSLRSAPILDGVWLWQFIALAMLAAGTVVFIILFVRVLERGVSLQVESHWGGLGGGLGGWRVSSSLTYLAMAAAFGVLFAIFVLKLEPPPPKTLPPAAQTADAAKKAEPAGVDAKASAPDKAR